MELVIGIDVGKLWLDVYEDGLKVGMRFANTAGGVLEVAGLVAGWIQAGHGIGRILCEATGGYERTLVDGLRTAGLRVDVVHATHVRDFARACGRRAKTDGIDAAMIARYGRTMAPRAVRSERTAEEGVLRRLLCRRQSLIAARVAETNRLDKTLPAPERRSIRAHVAWLKDEVRRIEADMRAMLVASPALQAAVRLLSSVPGIGELTALTLLVELPELGALELPQLAALTGLAPYNRDSGKFSGRRHIQGGRVRPRNALYMAALASLRHNKPIRAFYDRLRSTGKPAKVALIACARKLLAILNAIAKRNTPYSPATP